MDIVERRRGDLLLTRIKESWTSWRGSTIEPLIRDSLWRLLPDDQLSASPSAIGSFWNRSNTIEIDIVGADRAPIAQKLLFLGSIKWREESTFVNASPRINPGDFQLRPHPTNHPEGR